MARSVPTIGIVSLGCPKALVDSERILTRLRAEGYGLSGSYDGADLVLVNTCGFLDSARAESLEAIGEALEANGRVIVTGCLGEAADLIRAEHHDVLAITGAHQYEQVVDAVHRALPPRADPFTALVPPEGIRLTPRHYAYVKIAEGCDHRCSFCIIPSMRGSLQSRPASEVLHECDRLVRAGVKELLVISQDTSAYGRDLRYATSRFRDREVRAKFADLCRELAQMEAWVRLHYVYPYPHVDEVIPLMTEGGLLPYLDIPFQHADPAVLRAMRRPAAQAKTLERLHAWRREVPELTVRSTFIVGFPGETEAAFTNLLDWLEEAQLDRVGCFVYEPVEGAAANVLADPVPEEVKHERYHRFMVAQQAISAAKQAAKVGRVMDVLVDKVADGAAIARTKGDAPEIDGCVHIDEGEGLAPGEIVRVRITGADAYDLDAERIE